MLLRTQKSSVLQYDRCNRCRRTSNPTHINRLQFKILGVYRKTHIPDGPGYEEKFYFNPGDTGFKVWNTKFAKIGIAICWDQWFPEAARCLVLQGAELLFYPTAIGSGTITKSSNYLPDSEPTDPKYDSMPHWQRTMQGHSAANIVPVIASNRTGMENIEGSEITFYGSSFITNHIGEKITEASRDQDNEVLTATFDLDQIHSFRRSWGLFRDRRPDMYKPILTMDGSTQ